MTNKNIRWQGVFPAVTTQFNADFSINFTATHQVMKNLINDGVSGLIVNGSVGENTSLNLQEKREIVEIAVDAAAGKIPVLSGVAELTTESAREMVAACRQGGANGVMVMPPLVYTPTINETVAYLRTIALSTDLPIMLYNNPLIYRNNITAKTLSMLIDCENIVAFKDSSGSTNPFIDIPNQMGDRFMLFAGLDDIVLECVTLGAVGWISGISNAFPREGETLFRLVKQQRLAEALPLYRWFMPLLHLDFRPDLVQCIKLCEEMLGRGSALTRPPRLALEGEILFEVRTIVEKALATRPLLPDVGLTS